MEKPHPTRKSWRSKFPKHSTSKSSKNEQQSFEAAHKLFNQLRLVKNKKEIINILNNFIDLKLLARLKMWVDLPFLADKS